MRKKCFSLMAVLILTLSVCMTAFAEGESNTVPPIQEHGGTAAELKSYGKIVYQKGTDTIKIDSDDLYMLADQIDQVKLDVTDQLEALNTYFSTGEGIALSTSEDINVVHATPAEEEAVDPLDVNFDTLLEGIAVSQSVSSDVTAYGYPAGTELYKNASGVLTTNGSEKGAEKIGVTAATADNLSAGTAAWVNGSLILRTGEDNRFYQEEGYKNGQSDSSAKGLYQITVNYRASNPSTNSKLMITIVSTIQIDDNGNIRHISTTPGTLITTMGEHYETARIDFVGFSIKKIS